MLPKSVVFFRDKRNARKAAKYYVLGANFGPFYSKRYLSFYKKFFSNYCQDVCFRDRYSASLFSDVSNVRYAPDILFNVELPKVVRRKKLFISVVDLNQVNKFKNLSKKRLAYDQLIMNILEICTILDMTLFYALFLVLRVMNMQFVD